MSTRDVFIFIKGGCVETATDEAGADISPVIFDFDTDGVCPVCQRKIDPYNEKPCVGCGYDPKIGTVQEAIRAAKHYEMMMCDPQEGGFDGTVDVIASGYEWICPACEKLNNEIEVLERVKCGRCQRTFDANPPEHACQ